MTNFKNKKHLGMAISCIGNSHVKNGMCCQDKSAYLSSYSYRAIIVCDGHGGNKHFRSQIGAETAINICRDIIPHFAKKIKKKANEKQALKELESNLVTKWREAVSLHLMEHPIIDKELVNCSETDKKEISNDSVIIYGTTIIVAILCKNNLFVFQLGDGNARIITNNGIERLFKDDATFIMGRTTSLCNREACLNIKDVILPVANIKCCFISTDGVYNSFSNESFFNTFIEKVFFEVKNNDVHFVINELKEFLPNLTKNGSGDDVSVAILK